MDFKSLFNQYLEVINRFVPRPQQVPVLGIDIGTSTVRAVEIGRAGPAIGGAGAGFEIRLWALEGIQGGDVKAALSRLLEKIHYTGQTLVTSVSGKGTLIRYIDMPRMPLDDLRRSFVYDLDKYFPFDPQSIYTDCFILDSSNAQKRMSVLVVAVKKEIIDERLKLFKDLGLKLEHITTDTVAMVNAFTRLGPHPGPADGPAFGGDSGAKAILDIGEDVSNLIILKDLSPRFTRDIFVGGREMTKQIAHVFGVDESKAEGMKKAPGEGSDAIVAACEGSIASLIEEIRLSLDYFMTEKNIQVGEFFLLGGGSLLKGIEGVFEKNLGIPVKIWDPVTGLPAGQAGLRLSPLLTSSDIHLPSSQLGVAIGLGLSEI
ncbi:MAG: pilus assembly protein PilM [Candidatus Omnitrophica bacterium]|nr:pilus assembly protein PilM [Candidatus Omnitrophota bacterium]